MVRGEKIPEKTSEQWALDVYEFLFETITARKRDLGRRKRQLTFADHNHASKLAVDLDKTNRKITAALSFYNKSGNPVRQSIGEVLDAIMPVGRTPKEQHPQGGALPMRTPVAAVVIEVDMGTTTIHFKDTIKLPDGTFRPYDVHTITQAHESATTREDTVQFLARYVTNGEELTK